MATFHCDIETRSSADLRKYGAARYASDASTEIILCAVAREDEPVLLWDVYADQIENSPAMELLIEMASAPAAVILTHNVGFEMMVFHYKWEKTFGFPGPKPEQFRCSMALCRVAKIPQSLEKAAEFLKLDIRKDAIGKLLIKKFCVPQKIRGKEETYWIGPDYEKVFTVNKVKIKAGDAWTAFRDYCLADVEVERQIYNKLKPLELKGWVLESFLLDARLNLRGVPVDLDAVDKALAIIEEVTTRTTEEFRELTGVNPGQNKEVLKWLRDRGYPGDNLQIGTVTAILGCQETEEGLEDDEDPEVEAPPVDPGSLDTSKMTPEAWQALNLRVKIGYAALKKLPTMKNAVCPDGRLRGMFLWHGAGTGRYTSKVVQLQNLKRPSKTSEEVFRTIRDGGADAATIEMMYGSPLENISSAIRHFIGYPDKPIIGADYSQIEARVLPWLAGHTESVEQFRQGRDAYSIAAASALGVDYEVAKKEHRQLGKVIVLACIAENSLVLTDKGLLPIQEVSTCHRVWDGVEWVHHEGVIYKGVREVITYQGLTATPDHKVFVEGETTLTLSEARRSLRNLTRGCPNRDKSGEVGHNVQRAASFETPRPRGCGMHRMWNGGLRILAGPPHRENAGMQQLRSLGKDHGTLLVDEANAGGEGPLRMSSKSRMAPIWGQRYILSLENSGRRSKMGDGEHRLGEGQRGGPDRQQQRLRAGKLTVVYPTPKCHESGQHKNGSRFCVQRGRMALRPYEGHGVHEIWVGPGADTGASPTGGKGKEKKLEEHRKVVQSKNEGAGVSEPRGDVSETSSSHVALYRDVAAPFLFQRDDEGGDFGSGTTEHKEKDVPCPQVEGVVRYQRVYDIVNAGPRHRFTVSGVLVHNCGFAGGLSAMDSACDIYKMSLTTKEKRKIVKDWRKANSPIVKLWKDLGDASVEAVLKPGRWVKANDKARFACSNQLGYPCLVMELPSGRKLYYPYPVATETYKIKRLLPGITADMIPRMEQEGLDTHEWKQIPKYQAMGSDEVLFKGVWASWELTYLGQIKGSIKWGRIRFHPGVASENLTQAVGSDFLTLGAMEAEKRGFRQILTVHDEIASEYDPEKGQMAETLVAAMCELPEWAKDFPLGAVGSVENFYTK